jgi:hypothetical protein
MRLAAKLYPKGAQQEGHSLPLQENATSVE